MEKELNIFSFWAIDDMTDKPLMMSQLDVMKECGFNGVVFHPRRYNGKIEYLGREYMQLLSELILYAKSIGMDFWLYDENGWPSGSADGKVEKAMPDLSCKWLEYNNGAVEIKERSGINSLSAEGVKKFIELTHEAYKRELLPEAFEYVGGFFSDEVGFLEGHGACADRGGIPWSDELGKKYNSEFGADISGKLPLLFCEDVNSFKSWYWEQLSDLLANNFYAQINDWCKANGKLYTAHLKGEEHPFFSLGYNGSCFRALREVSVPGVDALERYTGNSYFPRIASSLAKQFGDGTAMAEAIGGAGWGLEPADVEKYAKWLIGCGINLIIFHINQLHLDYRGITDWPSSIPCHQPWRGAFSHIIKRLREEKCEKSDTLYITPVRGIMERFSPQLTVGMNEHDGDSPMACDASELSLNVICESDLLCCAGVNFDVTDERTFEEFASVSGEGIRLGNMCYKNIAAGDGCVFNRLCESDFNIKTVNEIISGKIIKRTDAENIRISIPKQSEWEILYPDENRCPVKIYNGKGTFDAEYTSDFILLVSDICEGVAVNGNKLVRIKADDYGEYYKLPKECLRKGSNEFVCSGISKGFAYVIGDFAVYNKAPYYELDKRQLFCKESFYIAQKGEADVDFIKSGYAFSERPVVCEKRINKIGGKQLFVDCNHIAAAHVFVNGADCGWVYKNNSLIDVEGLDDVILRCEVFQSAYNIYGPNNYVKGDNPLISPMQFEGIKNFADDIYLPQATLDDNFRLVKWSMAKSVAVLG